MNLMVLGAGAWGTALAISAGRRHSVSLCVRDPAQYRSMQRDRVNARYLPGFTFPESIELLPLDPMPLRAHCAQAELIVIGTPMAGLRPTLELLRGAIQPLVWLCKGFELAGAGGSAAGAGLLAHEVAEQVAPGALCGALSGPSFAQEVARGQPTALVAASRHESLRQTLVAAFHGPSLRIYANDDLIGVEVAGATKNVMAIASGLCDGLGLGLNARAALITRGLAEMTRLGLALGARAETFMGLSGLGDLVLTATGELSRNRRVGLLLAQGQSLQQALSALGHVAEGVPTASAVLQRAALLGVEMPITQSVVDLLDGRLRPAAAVAQLMGRSAAAEGA